MPTENTETTVQNNESVSSVWPLTQFFSVSFLYKITDWPGGQTPRRGKVVFFHSSQQLLRLRLEPLEGLSLLKSHFLTPILDCQKSTE